MQAAELDGLGQALHGRNVGRARIWRAGSFGLVHRQHVFTPADASEAMPAVAPSGSVMVADARLSGRDALARSLGMEGAARPDGALIHAAFDRWGTEAPGRIYGEFAAAHWNPQTQCLTLARDPSGLRTLYIHRSKALIAFSTRMRALLSLPEIARDLDEIALADLLSLNIGDPARTLYRAIERTPAGHVALVRREQTRVSRYWDLPEPGSLRHRNVDDLVQEARAVLDGAVADALRTIRPPGALLTGGLDSSAVMTSAASQLAPTRLLAMTRKPNLGTATDREHVYFDETDCARVVAARWANVDWHCVGDDGDRRDESEAAKWFLQAGAPSRAPQNITWFFPVYRFLQARGGDVLISGDQGNGFFSYSGLTLFPQLLLGGRWAALWAQTRSMARIQGLSNWTIFRRHTLSPFEPLPLRLLRKKNPGKLPWSSHSALNPAFAAEIGYHEHVDESLYRMRVGGGHLSTQAQRRWMCEDEIARDGRGVLRAFTGVDYRIPLADRRIVEFFGALPLEAFLENGVTRSIARRVLHGRAPDEIIHSRRRGFQGGDWFAILSKQRSAMTENVARLRKSPLASRVIDLDRLAGLLAAWPDSADAAEPHRLQYLQMLTRGLETARFLAWTEGRNL